MTPALQVVDLSGPLPADPRAQLALVDAQSQAQRGFDILQLAAHAFSVCNLCTRPAVLVGHRSACCAAPYHLQGWRSPGAGS